MGRVKLINQAGKIETPYDVAFYMVTKLFEGEVIKPTSRALDAGCGLGVFIEAIIAWCKLRNQQLPEIMGIEIDPQLAEQAARRFSRVSEVKIVHGDFLTINEKQLGGKFEYIISNPPYISYERIEPKKRDLYRRIFRAAKGRFDLYMLFFERAIELLRPGGRLVFITPEKYLYVISARNLRRILAEQQIEEIELIHEDTFEGVLAYPTIAVIRKVPPQRPTVLKLRDTSTLKVTLPRDGFSWLARAQTDALSTTSNAQRHTLKDIALRISAGIATGRDGVFVRSKTSFPREVEKYAYPTLSGSELSAFKPGEVIDYSKLKNVMLVPYSHEGRLLSEKEATPLIKYLAKWRDVLESRYAVKSGNKKWFAFHENPPLKDIFRPKIVWADIAREPAFYIDAKGQIIPRHTVYYLVPLNSKIIPQLIKYLNSREAKKWLMARCQRAANGYIRLQSHVLKELPIPEDFLKATTRSKGGLKIWTRMRD